MKATASDVSDNGPDSDCHYLTRVLAGDLDAYAGIMRRHNQRLFRLARSFVSDDSEAMDIVQEAFITAYRRLDTLDNPAALGHWLGRIVRNTALMRLRKNQRYQYMDEPDVEKALSLSEVVQSREQPDHQLANAQLRKVLEDCIDQLPSAFRAVFMLRAVEQCSIHTTAEILELKEATVKTRFHRARTLLQKSLLERCESGSIAVHEFAGHRCDTIVRNVLQQLRGCVRRRKWPPVM